MRFKNYKNNLMYLKRSGMNRQETKTFQYLVNKHFRNYFINNCEA